MLAAVCVGCCVCWLLCVLAAVCVGCWAVVCCVFHVTFSDPHHCNVVDIVLSEGSKNTRRSPDREVKDKSRLSRPLNNPCICDEFLRP